MKASTKTLQNMLEYIPLLLRGRYGTPLAVQFSNEVLGEMEQVCDADHFVGETGLLLVEGVTDYPLDAAVRHVKGIYAVQAGDVIPDKHHPVGHELIGTMLRLEAVPTLTGDEDITGTVPAGAPASKAVLFDDTAGKLDSALEEDELLGRLVKVTHAPGASQTVEYKVLKGNTPDDTTADVNGELAALAAQGDTYLITSNFLIIEHQRYLTRVTGASSVLDIPQDFENLFRFGLTWKYHLQADKLSKETRQWGEDYNALLNNFRIDATKHRGTAVRNSPRSMPRLFN